ncbi:uncharacterized protein LOC105920259 [Fundulus heteroclitus]|uniref:uncharacterized protein LOC105920259 n=1 Tax=Fundulus heteroclitus TaxID=8078 RepID=UPI00165C2010|nr:uncharacterized protein LOC105920259 [Fundulus heteroclitus]
MMSLFLILLIIIKAPGIDASTVFVQTGGDVFLNVSEADIPQDLHFFLWKFVSNDVLVSFFSNGEPKIHEAYAGRIELLGQKHSIKLKNLQKSDSGLYTAVVTAASKQTLTEYNVTVQDPVSPVDLVIDSVSSASSSCNLTVTCITEDSDISSTFRCTTKTCHQEGGEKSKATKSGASLHVCLSNLSIVCNHSNRVSWSEKKTATDLLCYQYIDADGLSGVSICVVMVVGLIIMVLAVIGVHLTEKFKK